MKALVPIAHGSESLETVTLVNVLRRGGIEVTVASVENDRVVDGTRDIRLVADARYADVGSQEYDLIALPGGDKGATSLAKYVPLVDKLIAQRIAHKWYGAICASPALVLSPHGLLDGKQATCFPALRDKLLHFVDQPVVVDGHCVTSQGPATAIAFGLQLVALLAGEARSREVAEALLAG